MTKDSYALIDSGGGRKLEQFGRCNFVRPSAQALWLPMQSEEKWKNADAIFTRYPNNQWVFHKKVPKFWEVQYSNLTFKVGATDFGHLGLFPEHQHCWKWIQQVIRKSSRLRTLNLFAYTGGATLAAAKAGAHVCHVDSSSGINDRARENAGINSLSESSIRWITDDARKFVVREKKRQSHYEGIILDPPSFGRGKKGEVFKIDEHIIPLLQNCRELLSDQAKFLYFSCHTPGFTPLVMQHLLSQVMAGKGGTVESGEMILQATDEVFSIPSGTYARWSSE